MTHTVVCQNDAVNYDFSVIVDDKIATAFPYTSWFVPHGMRQTSAQAVAEDLTLKLATVFSDNAASYVVGVNDNGTGFDVLLNDHTVITYHYSGVWVIGGLLASKTSAMASAYQLAQNLSSILHTAFHKLELAE